MTVGALAGRLGVAPSEVEAMLSALRASGLIGPGASLDPGTDGCPSSGSCVGSCPGPSGCPFVIGIGVMLELRN